MIAVRVAAIIAIGLITAAWIISDYKEQKRTEKLVSEMIEHERRVAEFKKCVEYSNEIAKEARNEK